MSWRPTRRQFLRSAMGTVGLPLLPSLGHATEEPIRRFVAIYAPGGVIQLGNGFHPYERWRLGSDMSAIQDPLHSLYPLRNYTSEMIQIQNIRRESFYYGTQQLGISGAIGHWGEHPNYLTGSSLLQNDRDNYWDTLVTDEASIDQKIAAMTGNRPLNIGMSPRWSWHVLDTLSWFSATQADPAMQDPLLVYARLFGSAAERADRARFQRMLALRRSVLDGIVDQQASLDQRLGHADRHHLDAYFTNLRETELRLSEDRTLVCTEPPEADYGDRNKETWAHLNVDLTLLAFDCQATNVVTISTWGAGGGVGGPVTGEYIPGLNNPIEDYHHFSHFADGFGVRPEFDDFVTVTDWSVGHLTRIVEGLAARTDPDGESMLHNSLVMYGSGIGDAAGHEYSNVARIFLGRLGGLVNPGRVITPSGAQSPAENLLPEILDLFGYRKPDGSPQSVVGLSNGVISLR